MKAFELIEKGWCQGAFERDGRYCIEGAINLAYSIEDALRIKIRCCEIIKHYDLTAWNDAPERTQQEVIALLMKVES